MKGINKLIVLILLTILSVIYIYKEITGVNVPYLFLGTLLIGFYVICFITYLYSNLNNVKPVPKLEREDLPWAVLSVYTISFLVSFQGFRLNNFTIPGSFGCALLTAVLGIALCMFACSQSEKWKRKGY
jgi:hypothetical protein